MAILREILAEVIPTDHARQVHVKDIFADFLKTAKAGTRVLDLGCGDGKGYLMARNYGKDIVYSGIDIADSPEVRLRTLEASEFQTFDGIHIPFPTGHFDIVYSCSVLEHVRHPDELIKEVSRVLKTDGIFLGSVSFLEPYHSFSIFNFSPYGLHAVLADAGFSTQALRPGIDGVTITLRGYGLLQPFFDFWFHRESPLNVLISAVRRVSGKSVAWENAVKLQACGHIVFLASKRPASASPAKRHAV